MPLRALSRAFPLLATLLVACASPAPPAPVSPPPAPPAPPVSAGITPPAPTDPRAAALARLHVLMVNGGGKPEINFQTHLLHLKELRDLLVGAGVAEGRMTILSGDGPDPAPDLASRATTPGPDLHLIRGTRQEEALATPTVLVSSAIPGVALGVADKAAISAYFERAAGSLRAGDTLLLYVTDHGRPNPSDPSGNYIVLWNNERLTVRDLGELLDRLDPGVRVVALMSQCFSGAFASLALREDGRARAPFCGYFSTTATRKAYGCYPEDNASERPGHSFQIFHALRATRSLAEAHLEALLGDATPDAPLRTSDAYLNALLRKQAKQRGVPFEAFVDELLAAAAVDDPSVPPERALADRIVQRYGLAAPRSFAHLTEHWKELPALSIELDNSARKLRRDWMAYAQANLSGFFTRHPEWQKRVGDAALPSLAGQPDAVRALAGPFIADLTADTSPAMRDRLADYRKRINGLTAASYQADVRAGASLRVRTLLASLAGRVYLSNPKHNATPAERAGWEALRACEDLRW